MSRSDFPETGGACTGGFILGFYAGRAALGVEARAEGPAPVNPNAFIHIAPDNTVTVMVHKSEMGQGVYTSIPMLIAEELECDWKSVRVEPAPVAPVYANPMFGVQATGGSTSVRSEWDRMREVGAAAREMLLCAAAETWNVDRAGCRAQEGRVVHRSGKAITYGELAEKASKLPIPKDVPLKDPSSFKIIGKPTGRLDTPPKVDGKAAFGSDARMPGMLVALVARCPVFGGKVKGFDAADAKAVPGVREVVEIPSGVAVVADGFWQAKKGRDALKVEWDEGPFARFSTDSIRDEYRRLATSPGTQARKDGDPEKAMASAYRKVTAEYEVPYLAHADMEPLSCAIDFRPDAADVWAGTQAQTINREDAARVLGLAPEKVCLHTMYLGGGFGRRGNPHSDYVVMAAEVAKAVNKPVKVVWTREDDTKGGFYRPFWYEKVEGGLDEAGRPVAWRHTIVGQSIMRGTLYAERRIKDDIDATSVEGAADMPYEIPNVFVGLHSPELAVTVQWWRSVGHSQNGFVVESFMDEMAFAAGKDPYEFRRALLARHPRHGAVLDLAAQKAGWGTPLSEGRSRGISLCESYGSIVCEVAEVTAAPSGDVRVHRVVCAVDCGRTVNPSTIEAQMESGIVFGLSAALYGAITIKDGRVEQANFNDYPVLRIDVMPEVEVHIVPSARDPGGVGEPGTAPIAAAVTNAVFAGTGRRIRRLPIMPAAPGQR